MKLLQSFINSGIRFADTPTVKRGVQLSNAIGLILFAFGLLGSILYYVWYGLTVVTLINPLIGTVALLVVLFNCLGLPTLSRIWISLFPPIFITFLSIYSKTIYYDQQQELDYFTFRILILGTLAIPWVVFSLKEKKTLILSAAIGVAILLAYDPLHIVFNVPYQQDKLKVINYYFTNIIIFITYCILVGSLIFLKWISEKNEDRNIELIDNLNNTNEILVERNGEIEAQSAEILAQSEVLHNNQQHLIEANSLIEEQRRKLIDKNQILTSELVEKNENLTETNTELIKHNNELRQFSYTVSHNLRGPVASLLGLIDLIDEEKLDDNDREIFNYIDASAQQLDQIIKDLSKIIDIRHDIFRIRQRIDLNSEISEIGNVLKRELETHQVQLSKNVTLCPYIYSVKPMVGSILYNLVSNAIKYRSTERTPSIEITSRQEDSFYVIEVKDNGLGIDINQNKENLFKLYKRFHFHTEGRGLGLYLVKMQSEALGGTVAIESEINRYTKFTIRLQKPGNIERQILYDETFAELFYDAELNATGVIWKGPITSEQYRSVFRKCLDLFYSFNTPNYISDISAQGPIEPSDQRWMLQEILPYTTKNGLRKIAVVYPEVIDLPLQEYIQHVDETIKKLGLYHHVFTSFEGAFDWLRQENEKAALQHQL